MSDGNTKTTLDDARGLRVGQILNDFLDARARGEAVNEAELLTKHPDLADELRQHLELLGELRPATDKIEALIAQGILSPCNAEEGGDRLRAKVSGTDSPRGACPRFPPRYLAQLGPYKIFGILGSGGMGFVLKAYEESLNRVVALKILRPELAGDKAALARFTREAKAAAALKHPNIVTVYAVGQERDTHYLAMEYVEGPNLANVIRDPNVAAGAPAGRGSIAPDTSSAETDRALSASEGNTTPTPQIPNRESSIANPELVRHIFRQLLSALAAAHEAGLIHRDVKSSNILLDCGSEIGDWGLGVPDGAGSAIDQSPIHNRQSPIVKLADFGLARMITAQTRVTLGDSILGTPEYMSPEQARGDENIDHRSDLYSAGIVLYEMLTGRTPFRADTPSAVIHQILNVDPPEPKTTKRDVDLVLAHLALWLMAKRPEDRPASASEALEVLEHRQMRRHRGHPKRIRRRAAVLAGVLAVAVFAIWVVQSVVRGPGEIAEVRVTGDGRIVQVRYEVNGWTDFYAAPTPGATANAELVDLDGTGRCAVVFGVNEIAANGSLIALDSNGKKLWDLFLHDEAERDWPDCGLPYEWDCSVMAVGNLDAEPGDEIVATAVQNNCYMTMLAIVKPSQDAGEVKAVFWHMGGISSAQIEQDFFSPGGPAIVVRGVNNKLDGFNEEAPAKRDTRLTRYDYVPVLMILDPRRLMGLESLGPPADNPLNIPSAHIHAYAFLDLAGSMDVTRRDGLERFNVEPHEHGALDFILSYESDDPYGRWRDVGVFDLDWKSRAHLTLDRNLQVIEIRPAMYETVGTDVEYWRELWRVIIQDGEYVDE